MVGRPLPADRVQHERLSRVTGLAVLSSDPLSSVAYATEEILRVLVIAGVASLALSAPIALSIAAILVVVVVSYRQIIYAYPNGGGAYIVARENLGERSGLVAAAALLMDYVLTVAVSITAGVAALTSAAPVLRGQEVALGLAALAVLVVGNLRGVRESGRLFAAPTYLFISSMLALLASGAWRWLSGDVPVPAAPPHDAPPVAALGMFLVLRAFANGCTAMTGVEAVSNGIPAFRPPEARNAASTLVAMAALSVTMFLGITWLALTYGVAPAEGETVLSQIARTVFDTGTAPYYAVQVATLLILVLAANTAFADFPRLASILARDGYLPRQLQNRGDRLAFSNGILGLGVFAALLLVAFQGDTHALIPLYMVGVFLAFTLSQAGMVVRWRRSRSPGWRRRAGLNGLGAAVTALVLAVVAATKTTEGAWLTLVLIPAHVAFFRATRRHYQAVAAQLRLPALPAPPTPRRHVVVVLIGGVHRAVVNALDYARSLAGDVRAVYVALEPATTDEVRAGWAAWGRGVPLVVLDSEYRSLLTPVDRYLTALAADPDLDVTVVLPEFVPARWWHHLFHNQRALLIKGFLLRRPNVVVTNVPFHLVR